MASRHFFAFYEEDIAEKARKRESYTAHTTTTGRSGKLLFDVCSVFAVWSEEGWGQRFEKMAKAMAMEDFRGFLKISEVPIDEF